MSDRDSVEGIMEKKKENLNKQDLKDMLLFAIAWTAGVTIASLL